MLNSKLILSTLFLATAAHMALGQNYAHRGVPIRAAIGVIDSDQTNGVPSNATPYVWYNLDNNSAVKPAEFNFVNPSHESQVTPAIFNRWVTLTGGSPGVGSQLTKQDGAYWELSLTNASDDQMANLDVILISSYKNLALNNVEREKLRRFMEKGGVLWVDVNAATTAVDPVNNLPLPFRVVAGGGTYNTDYSQPLMSYPNAIGDPGFFSLPIGQAIQSVDLAALGWASIKSIVQTIEPDSTRFITIYGNGAGQLIKEAHIGDGFLVITGGASATFMNHVPSAGGYLVNQGSVGLPPAFDPASDECSKFALNMINLTSGFNQMGGGTRKAGSNPVDLGAPELVKWLETDTPNGTSGSKSIVPPALYKGLCVVVTQNQVFVYNANPKDDLDGDGDPDDGIRDYANGSNVDLLWASQALAGPISAPTCAEVPNATTPALRDQVQVVDSTGKLLIFSAFQNSTGKIVGSMNVAPDFTITPQGGASSFSGGDAPGPYPPTFNEGYDYIADAQNAGLSTVGRVWIADPATGQQVTTAGGSGWMVGGIGTGVIPEISGPATVGYIPIQDNSGGLDKVVYVPTKPNPTSGGPNSTAGITSLWVGAKGESPLRVDNSTPGLLQISTRASSQALNVYLGAAGASDPLGVRLVIIDGFGNPMPPSQMATTFTGGISQAAGVLQIPYVGALPANFSVRVDYTIDWGTGDPATTSSIMRGQLFMPDDANRTRRIIGGIALSPKGTMYITTSTQDYNINSGGSYMAIREEGRGTFNVITRFDMFNQHTVNLNQANDVVYPDCLQDTDPLDSLLPPFMTGAMQNLTFMSSPTYSNGQVFVTAQGTKGFFKVPFTILMAFAGDPQTIDIKTGDLGPGGFTILQPDLLRSSNKLVPEVFSTLQSNQYVYERHAGTDAGTIRISNLSATTRGPMLNSLNLSQPIIIRRNAQPDVLLEPNQSASHWNPLIWYMTFPGTGQLNPSAPLVTGNTVFMSGLSGLAGLVTLGKYTAAGAILYGLDAKIPPTDPFLVPDPNRPWLQQLYQLETTVSGIKGDPHMLWPQFIGINSFNDWLVRVNQTILKKPDGSLTGTSNGVVGGEGGLYAWTDDGVWAFTKARFIVADQGRVAQFDSAGNPEWIKTSTLTQGDQNLNTGTQTTPNVQNFVTPMRAYPISDRSALVVDPGANRISVVDMGGKESRTVNGFSVDPAYKPDGFDSNEPLTFSRPMDALEFTTIQQPGNNLFGGGVEQWVHYLIADTGNRRIVEIVDRYDYSTGTRGVLLKQGELLWHSPATVSGKRYDYSCISRIFIDDLVNPRYVYAAGVGGSMPTRVDTGLDPGSATAPVQSEGSGGIVIFDGANSDVINSVDVPPVAANVYWDDATGTWNSPAESASHKKAIKGLSSVTMKNISNGAGGSQLAIMFTDSDGVFEITGGAGAWAVRWMLPRQVYSAIRRDAVTDVPTVANPLDFRPTYARRLESGEVLISNGYVGSFRRALATDPWLKFTGEVFQIDGDFDPTGSALYGFDFTKRNLGFSTLSIRFQLPPITGARGIVMPVFVDRR